MWPIAIQMQLDALARGWALYAAIVEEVRRRIPPGDPDLDQLNAEALENAIEAAATGSELRSRLRYRGGDVVLRAELAQLFAAGRREMEGVCRPH
jgi:hypothetical protein